jgi:hypothetical protein
MHNISSIHHWDYRRRCAFRIHNVFTPFSPPQTCFELSVICQRQMQKGNLATIAVDSAGKNSNKKKASTGFTKEELRDCFTLKEECDCDTKAKIGNKWPSYGKFDSWFLVRWMMSLPIISAHATVSHSDGVSSIVSEGCVDKPLIATVSEEGTPISFVHVVKTAEEPISTSDESMDNELRSIDDTAQTSDEENHWTDISDKMEDSRDEENEF